MSAVPGDLSTDRQPPMAVPLRYFLTGFAFLVGGAGVGVASILDATPGLAALAHVHLLLVGWVCLTIMGAMTQFVPVWSNVPLYSRRLANATLALVAVGVAGLVWAFLIASPHWIHGFGGLLLVGVWTFAYNLGRTLADVSEVDVLSARCGLDATEAHFAFAVCCFALVAALGFVLATDFSMAVLPTLGVTRPQVVAAHATLAVFGAILGTVFGALYQLGTMFTQTDLHGVDVHLARVEYAYPVGVVALATGRLLATRWLALVGGLLVVAGALAFATILARKLIESRVERTPMLTRYWVVALALAAWSALAATAWLRDPLSPATLFGPVDASHVLFVGVVGFVVLGSLYHVVPFVVWEHRYSDRIGLEPVPMIDDLYDHRVARLDFALLLGGWFVFSGGRTDLLPPWSVLAGATVLATGFLLGVANLAFVVWSHGRVLPGRIRESARNAD